MQRKRWSRVSRVARGPAARAGAARSRAGPGRRAARARTRIKEARKNQRKKNPKHESVHTKYFTPVHHPAGTHARTTTESD